MDRIPDLLGEIERLRAGAIGGYTAGVLLPATDPRGRAFRFDVVTRARAADKDAGLLEANVAYHAVALRPLVPQRSRPPGRPLRPFDPARRASRRAAETLRQTAFAATIGERPPATLAAYAELWLARQAARVKVRSIEGYRMNLRVHIIPAFGEATRLASITRPMVRDFLLGRLAEGYAPATVRIFLAVLRMLFNAARFEDGLLQANPADRLTQALPRREEPNVEKVLRPDALQRLLEALASFAPRLYPLVVVAAACGLRAGELCGLVWPDVSLEQRTVVIRHSRDARGRLGTPKGKKAVRLPLSDSAVTALRALQEMPPVSREPWVFASPYGGKPWSRTHIRRTLRRACRLAGIPDVSIHVLRHTFVTAAAATGADVWTVQTLARHANVATTQQYIHLARTAPRHVEAMETVEHYLFRPPADATKGA